MIRVRVGVRYLQLAEHTIERYGERVKPALTREQIATELVGMLAGAELVTEMPAWITGTERADEWVLLTDAIVFPVIAGRITTCLTRGEVGAEIRVVRAQERRERRERDGRPGARKKHGKVARDARNARRRVRDGREAMGDG